MLRLKDGEGRDILDWRSWPRPKRGYQWKCGRSAMELARAWFTSPRPVVPPEIEALLRTAGITVVEGWPEHVTSLPERGEGRNHDLLLQGEAGGAAVVVSIEAKVDETFGEQIGRYYKRKRQDSRSGLPKRMETLLKMVFGENAAPDDEPWASLRYQLLTAVTGTAIEARNRNAKLGVFVVHELHTDAADEKKLAKNTLALAHFVEAAGAELETDTLIPGRLYGPIKVRLNDPVAEVDILLGRAIYDWRDPSHSSLPNTKDCHSPTLD